MSKAEQLYVRPGHSGVNLPPKAYGIGDAPQLELKNAAQWIAHVISVSSTTITPQGSMDGVLWIDLESAITPSAATIHRGDCTGFPYVRFSIGGGVGTIGFALSDKTVAEFAGTVSVTGVSTEAKQDTQISALGNVTSSIAVSATLPVGDEGNATVVLNGASGVEFEVTAVSGLHVTVEAVLASGGTYRQVESIQVASQYGRIRVGGTDITLVSADKIIVVGDYYAVRLKRASGTSATVTTRTMTQAAAMKILTARVERKPISNQNIANGTLDDAGGTALTVPTGTTGVRLNLVETTLSTAAVVYVTDEGSTPSATEGETWKCMNLPFEVDGVDMIAGFKFLAADAGSRLAASYYEDVLRIG